MDVGYNHNWDGSFTVTDNTLLDPTSFDEFCITVPNDSRLPNSGQQQCGYYDIKPELFGQGTLRVTNAKEFVGKNGNTKLPQRYWDGVWVSAERPTAAQHRDWRRRRRRPPGRRSLLHGGHPEPAVRRHRHRRGDDVERPQQLRSRRVPRRDGLDEQPGLPAERQHPDQGRIQRQLHLPQHAGRHAEFDDDGYRGERSRSRTVALSSTLTTPQVINLITPNSLFGARFNQLDLSVNKSLNLGWGRLRLAFDLYNALNANSIQNVTTDLRQLRGCGRRRSSIRAWRVSPPTSRSD